jgi:hypothetical protein
MTMLVADRCLSWLLCRKLIHVDDFLAFTLLSFSILILPWLLDLFNAVIQILSASCYLDWFKRILEK